jgi:hypothetical protein
MDQDFMELCGAELSANQDPDGWVGSVYCTLFPHQDGTHIGFTPAGHTREWRTLPVESPDIKGLTVTYNDQGQ